MVERGPEADAGPRWRRAGWYALLLVGLGSAGCVTVRPEQRAVLADPTMQYDAEDQAEEARRHALENREASFGGGTVRGGGCGCN